MFAWSPVEFTGKVLRHERQIKIKKISNRVLLQKRQKTIENVLIRALWAKKIETKHSKKSLQLSLGL